MNTVERVKMICKERKIPLSRLERECGFSNGYIGQLRKGSIPVRTVGNWCTGERACPEYTRIMMQEILGLVRR